MGACLSSHSRTSFSLPAATAAWRGRTLGAVAGVTGTARRSSSSSPGEESDGSELFERALALAGLPCGSLRAHATRGGWGGQVGNGWTGANGEAPRAPVVVVTQSWETTNDARARTARSRAGGGDRGRGGGESRSRTASRWGYALHGRRRVGRDDDVQVHVGEADARGGRSGRGGHPRRRRVLARRGREGVRRDVPRGDAGGLDSGRDGVVRRVRRVVQLRALARGRVVLRGRVGPARGAGRVELLRVQGAQLAHLSNDVRPALRARLRGHLRGRLHDGDPGVRAKRRRERRSRVATAGVRARRPVRVAIVERMLRNGTSAGGPRA